MSIGRYTAVALDHVMCFAMYAFQQRHRLHAKSREALASYIHHHRDQTRESYFLSPPLAPLYHGPARLQWESPVLTPYVENNRAHVDLYPCEDGWSAPTVIFLHALMSTSDIGYRRWAARFNARLWNACFVHLPFHYSRKPGGFRNGELAITGDLVRTAEGLRQGVSEVRQLMAWIRSQGCGDFGLWASSYGGWIGALLASVESDFRFVGLMEPIVDMEHAIWTSPAGRAVRRELRLRQIEPELISRHYRLTSPMHAQPLCGPERAVVIGGEWDQITGIAEVERFHRHWSGSTLLTVPQGHFGYRMMPALWNHLEQSGLLDIASAYAGCGQDSAQSE